MKKLLFGVMTTVMVIMVLSVHLLVGILIYETCVRSSVEGAVASIILSLALLGMDATAGWMYLDIKEEWKC